MLLILLLLVSSNVSAELGREQRIYFNDQVQQMSLDPQGLSYRISLKKHAASYHMPKSGLYLSCLEDSLETHRGVRLEVEPKQLQIITCKPIPPKK